MDRESLMNNAIQGSQGTSLVVQRLRFHASNAEGVCSIPAQGTKIPHATGMAKKVGGWEIGDLRGYKENQTSGSDFALQNWDSAISLMIPLKNLNILAGDSSVTRESVPSPWQRKGPACPDWVGPHCN